jgi:predicted ArsR family transcriptional regulator
MTTASDSADPDAQQRHDIRAQAQALGDPTRFRIYSFVLDADAPVTIAALTDHIGVHHTATRQHVAKLVEAGLLEESTERRTTRGRPRKLYRVDPTADARWQSRGPYQRLSRLLVEVVATARSPEDVGFDEGARTAITPSEPGDQVDALQDAIARGGFDPRRRTVGGKVEFVLRRCPFADAADVDPDTVCDLHLGMARGLSSQLESIEVDELVRADPHKAGCRLRFHL